MQELSQAKGTRPCTQLNHHHHLLTTRPDQVQPDTPYLRSMPALQLSLHLRYALASAAMPVTTPSDPPPPDAVPKKRGPKTDVLEALLKRVDGLEKRLHSEKSESAIEDEPATMEEPLQRKNSQPSSISRPTLDITPNTTNAAKQLMSPVEPRCLYTMPVSTPFGR